MWKEAWLESLDIILVLIFIADFVFNIVVSDSWLFLLSRNAIVDYLTIVPLLIDIFVPDSFWFKSFGVYSPFRALVTLRIIRIDRTFDIFFQAISKRIALIGYTAFSIIFVASGLLTVIEGPENPEMEEFHTTFYFLIVTVSTVGYGDLAPVTPLGRYVIVCIVLAAVLLIPIQSHNLSKALSHHSGF